jgi:flagellar motor switch/type III secretory pathway protein FliN
VTAGAWAAPLLARSRLAGEAWNTLVSYADEPVLLEDGRTSVEFGLSVAPSPEAQAFLLAVERGPQFLSVLDSFPFDALVEADLEIGDLDRLPAALRDALGEGAITLVWNAVAADRFGAMTIADRGGLAGILARWQQDSITWLSLNVGGLLRDPVMLRVAVEPDAIAEAISGSGFGGRLVWPELQDVIERELHFTLGAIRLSMQEFRALACGDVVILEVLPPQVLLMRVDTVTLRFEEISDGFELVAIERRRTARLFAGHEGSSVMEADRAEVDEADLDDLADDEEAVEPEDGDWTESLEVVVDFDLGEVRLPLSELQSWRQGTVVVLDAPPRSGEVSVTVRVNGQVVGAGDLVRIDDRLGVRLSRLFLS